tara:strand:+ start:36 stop:365 length:330 start_codon:yes stop_codon:yes gene_type:complete
LVPDAICRRRRKYIRTQGSRHIQKEITFDEYWEQENHLLELSYQESVRQKEERGKSMKEDKTCAGHTEEKARSGECCKQKANPLDEFWHKLGDKYKKYVRSYRPNKRNI